MRRRIVWAVLVLWLLAGVISTLAFRGHPKDTRAATAAALAKVQPPSGFSGPRQCTTARSFCFRDVSLVLPMSRADATALVQRFGLDVQAKDVKCVVPIGCTGTGRFHDGAVAFIVERALAKPLRQAGTQILVVAA
jgi:hypothetical protein